MTVQLATADISFGSSTVARPSVQKQIFLARHNYWSEKTKIYTDLDSIIEDGVPSTSSIYRAARSHFAPTPHLREFKVGRLETTSIIAPVDVVTGKIYGLTLDAKDAAASVDFAYTAQAADTEEDIVTALKAAIDAQADITAKITVTVVGTGANATITLAHAVEDDWFTVSALLNVTETFPATPERPAAEELASINDKDDDYYVVTSDVKDGTFVTQLAGELESRFNFYCVSLAEADVYLGTATGSFKTLIADNAYLSTYPFYHHEAETTYPECAHMSEVFTLIDTGITFANRPTSGVGESKTVDGEPLTATQTNNLMTNGVNFFARTQVAGSQSAQALNSAISTGKDGGGRVASGEYAFNVVGRDVMQIEIEASLTDLLTSQKTGRLAWDSASLAKAYSSINKVMKKFANTDGWNLIYGQQDLDFPYRITLPELNSLSAADRKLGVLKNVTFRAFLKDAIHLAQITGNLDRPA